MIPFTARSNIIHISFCPAGYTSCCIHVFKLCCLLARHPLGKRFIISMVKIDVNKVKTNKPTNGKCPHIKITTRTFLPFHFAVFHFRQLLSCLFSLTLFSSICVHSVVWWYKRGERSWHWSPAFDQVSRRFVPPGQVEARHPSLSVTVELKWWQLTIQSKWSSIN